MCYVWRRCPRECPQSRRQHRLRTCPTVRSTWRIGLRCDSRRGPCAGVSRFQGPHAAISPASIEARLALERCAPGRSCESITGDASCGFLLCRLPEPPVQLLSLPDQLRKLRASSQISRTSFAGSRTISGSFRTSIGISRNSYAIARQPALPARLRRLPSAARSRARRNYKGPPIPAGPGFCMRPAGMPG